MLQNENLLAKIGVDTAEDEPREVWPACLACLAREPGSVGSAVRSEVNSELNFSLNFEGLVLGCINADVCK